MSSLLIYILKLSISLSVVFLFYQLVLRKLTFYNWNRYYLLVYSALCFFIPFIDLSPILEQKEWGNATVINWVPIMPAYEKQGFTISFEKLMVIAVLTGTLVMFLRLLIQLISFQRLLKKATLLSSNGIKVYQVNDNIIPFSFGNSIFINQDLHSREELVKIIRHEFVHVKQKHSADIIWGEILCVLNWYNPFAWLIKKSIRQNLEFIADDKVLQNGIDKKEYQYMLLKVIGNNQFSIAPKFNFSSLKKRIAMMNKNKSARANWIRFLFVVPVIAVVLLSFRKQIGERFSSYSEISSYAQPSDTVPAVKTLNNKGYFIDIIGEGGQCTVLIRDKNRKEVQRVYLNDWMKKQDLYEGFYGKILPPPDGPSTPLPPPPPPPSDFIDVSRTDFLKNNPDIENVGWVFNNDNSVALVHLMMKNGRRIEYDLRKKEERENFEKTYGAIVVPDLKSPIAPPPPTAPPAPVVLPDNLNKPDALLNPYEKAEKERRLKMKPGEDGC